jgi:acylphosphatase
MMACRYRVTGLVQGVGFRAFAARSARGLGVAGWCRNTRDGAVEGEAFGDEPAVLAFLGQLQRGPVPARVDELVVEPLEHIDNPGTSFLIRR